MKINKRQSAYIFEIIGMFFILGATCWQLFFVDTLEEMGLDTRFRGIENMLDTALVNLNDSSKLHLQDNKATLRSSCNTIDKQTWNTLKHVNSQEFAREKLKKGQTATFKIIRAGLFILGSLFLIFGKAVEVDIACTPSSSDNKTKTPLKE
jgi:hypothetical protein